MKPNFLFQFFALLFLTTSLFAQVEKDVISGKFNNLNIEQFVKELEKQCDCRFYFDKADFEGFLISVDIDHVPLSQALKSIFENTEFNHSIFGNRVFLTKDYVISTKLPKGFLGGDEAGEEGYKTTVTVLDYIAEKEVDQSELNLENKLYEIGDRTLARAGEKATLSGYIKNAQTGEPAIGVAVYLESPRIGTTTNVFGYYTMNIPKGQHVLHIQGIGMRATKRQILIHSDGKLDANIKEEVVSLREVVVTSERTANVKNVQMGVEKLNIRQIKEIPTAFGEPDILKIVLNLPGVQSVGEASSGLNVRGGAPDQNLILFSNATVYNPSHFFGLFSAFNPDLVKELKMYKSSIPAKYGGRLSSVLDVTAKDGSKKEFKGSAGIGLLTSRLNLEGPILKDRTSFIVGGRTTYSNWMLDLLPENSGYNNGRASFHDFNAGLNHQLSEKDNISFSGYFSRDNIQLDENNIFGYENRNYSLKWQRMFNEKLHGVFSAGNDHYNYDATVEASNPTNAARLEFDINQTFIKSDFSYFLNSRHSIDFGFSSIHYTLNRGRLSPLDENSFVVPDQLPSERGLETALYIEDQFEVSPRFSVNVGLRYSLFNFLGPGKVYLYPEGAPKSKYNVTDSLIYEDGGIINTYHGPEFRLSARYSLSESFSVKAGYNTLRQYIHMLTNTATMSPTDTWKLSDPNLAPQLGDQLSLGFYKNLKNDTYETSVELYYKNIHNFLDFRSGANLVMNHQVETDVVTTKGKAYGAEFMVKKPRGKLNGWVAYTYSRTLLRVSDPNAGEMINGGRFYPANYDRPHDFILTGNYRFSHRYSVSLNMTYSTGRPITVPVGKFYFAGSDRAYYTDRNAYRIPNFFRTDLSVNIDGNHKVHQLTHNSWTFGIYNLTARNNAYSLYFTSEGGQIRGYKLSIFGTAIPFINYNIRF